MTVNCDRDLRMIPLTRIEVMNPRDRNETIFEGIVENIRAVGLKKPITVTSRVADDGAEKYLLVCGEGRLKAFRRLGEERIPALVVSVSDEDAFVMSLTENLARRRYRPLELMEGLTHLRNKGYSAKEISEKTGLSIAYISDVETLASKGEERLLSAVKAGTIPIRAAIAIAAAGNDTKGVQAALQDAYESGELRGRQLMDARRLIQRRQSAGRSMGRGRSGRSSDVTSSSLVRAYQKEVQRQQMLVRRAGFAQQRLLFVIGALRKLAADDNFVNLLRAENLDSVPKYLGDLIVQGGQ